MHIKSLLLRELSLGKGTLCRIEFPISTVEDQACLACSSGHQGNVELYTFLQFHL